MSPASILDKTIRGFITPDSDDDLIGLAIGFQPGDASSDTADYLLITWKGLTQAFDYVGGNNASSPGGTCPVGLAISRVRGIPNHDEIWQRADFAGTAGGVIPIARGATLGSTAYNRSGGSHSFKVEYTAAAVRVYVDGVLQFDVAGSFAPARFAAWEQSQSPGATYYNFSVSELDDPDPDPPEPPGGVIPDGAWSIVLLPDTQYYAQSYPGIFYSQTSWIIDNLRRRNIRYVIGLGDITNTNAPAAMGCRAVGDQTPARARAVCARGGQSRLWSGRQRHDARHVGQRLLPLLALCRDADIRRVEGPEQRGKHVPPFRSGWREVDHHLPRMGSARHGDQLGGFDPRATSRIARPSSCRTRS